MSINFLAILVAAISSMVVGFVYYHPKVLGTVWMKESGLNEEDLTKGNVAMRHGIAFLLSFVVAFVLQVLIIHEVGPFGMIGGDVENAKPSFQAFMDDYAGVYRTFGHGVIHGGIQVGLLFVLPIVAINGIYNLKSWKYILVTGGYWVVTLGLMGGIISAWV